LQCYWKPFQQCRIALDIALGIQQLHSEKFVHLDLKPQNILTKKLDSPDADGCVYRAKVADFGLSRQLDDSILLKKGFVGTIRYAAPEIFTNDERGLPSDVFSFAVVLYVLYTQKRPWESLRSDEVRMAICKCERMPLVGVPDVVSGLIERCWAQNPAERPTIDVVVQDLIYYLESIQLEELQQRQADPVNGQVNDPEEVELERDVSRHDSEIDFADDAW
jgi:serine/threonine protein kinase